jgi:predicted esterase YcpF (UPF0227 family)
MKIFYIHGFGSCFKNSDKIETLSRNHEVTGLTYDTTDSPYKNFKLLAEASYESELIIGTSLGGWYAALVGTETGKPFVSINPAVEPQRSLNKYIGTGIDYCGNYYTLNQETVKEYDRIRTDGYGMVLVDESDEVINPNDIDKIDHNFEVHKFSGGSHRFEHIEESLHLIESFFNRSIVLGFNEA